MELARAVNPAGAPQGQKGTHGEQDKYVINIKQIAKFVVGLGDRVAPTDIEEGMHARYVVSDVVTDRPVLPRPYRRRIPKGA